MKWMDICLAFLLVLAVFCVIYGILSHNCTESYDRLREEVARIRGYVKLDNVHGD